ncbi:helix-turn-helix domain-containing protein [Sphingobacterium sp. DK4209]|uniref:Helix-turn-helix domain-containing protein n=1 Tax=Sphingobacterium zhuxiongii TaxID=2662364 RepID=A0A5Q0QCA7_9SPHI|nr:Crp/Fnr family transcriptional regulator [Sphingobacterium sp. DK4209]MVZ67621.1 helix-turn-helix domain-containing protein [Sphingobacterium sp. DK4209]QGA27146.1 helix-turn-helix domain-containing protein [Sphingobacterium sp. dk4302]
MITEKFDFLLHPALREEFERDGVKLSFKAGDILVEPQKCIKIIPLVLKGNIRVLRQNEDGQELFIYYIKEGQSCAISLSTMMMDKLSNIRAIAEEDVELIGIPSPVARHWYETYPAWRWFVLNTLDFRYEEILSTLDSVAFKKIDERLIEYLATKSESIQNNSLTITHQEIANELSTSREVISRLLKQLEQRGMVKLFRNKVEIISLV